MISCVKKTEFVVGTHLKPENCSKSIEFVLMCRNHSWHGWYCIWAKSDNYDVIKFWIKNNFRLKIATKTQNCRRKLKLVSNGAESQADSENI